MFGVCLSLNGRFSEAEDVFELATTLDSHNIMVWTMRGDLENIIYVNKFIYLLIYIYMLMLAIQVASIHATNSVNMYNRGNV